MKFRKVTSNKYIGTDGYSLIKCADGLFSICKDKTITDWGTGFKTVRSAEIFLNDHDYIKATHTFLPFDEEELRFIIQMYGDKLLKKNYNGPGKDLWSVNEDYSIAEDERDGLNVIDLFKNGKLIKQFDSDSGLFERLDAIACSDNVFASVGFISNDVFPILAAKNKKRRSTQEIARDLIRVKSSNVWSYGVEVSNEDPKVGNVYIQFKGKKGGPGDIYVYYEVPLSLWRKFISYPSKGAFVWKYLRHKFYYSKLTGDKRGVLPNAIN